MAAVQPEPLRRCVGWTFLFRVNSHPSKCTAVYCIFSCFFLQQHCIASLFPIKDKLREEFFLILNIARQAARRLICLLCMWQNKWNDQEVCRGFDRSKPQIVRIDRTITEARYKDSDACHSVQASFVLIQTIKVSEPEIPVAGNGEGEASSRQTINDYKSNLCSHFTGSRALFWPYNYFLINHLSWIDFMHSSPLFLELSGPCFLTRRYLWLASVTATREQLLWKKAMQKK